MLKFGFLNLGAFLPAFGKKRAKTGLSAIMKTLKAFSYRFYPLRCLTRHLLC
jgi:hypothetical protein